MDYESMLEKYARLLIHVGVNLQRGQTLVISALVECAPFVKLLTHIAYVRGAADVIVKWDDEDIGKQRLLWAKEETLKTMPEWEKTFFSSYDRDDVAFLTISAGNPELLHDVDPTRISYFQLAWLNGIKNLRNRIMGNRSTWTDAPYATLAWAEKVFPGIPKEVAVAKLWEVIFSAVRVDALDPVVAWEDHLDTLRRRVDVLNRQRFVQLHLRNSLGTDLTMELPSKHQWLGGRKHSHIGIGFVSNMPTEEVYTVPQKTSASGTVVGAKPLVYNGTIIDRMMLRLENGKVVWFTAETGYEALRELIAADEGAAYLGEIALVPQDSLLSQMNLLFYNTLFDENVASHLALGRAYLTCLCDTEDNKKKAMGMEVNDSLIHADFVIGTSDLEVKGINDKGEEIVFFSEGNFVEEVFSESK